MKPSRGFFVWTALAVCAVLVIGAMIWLTRGVMLAERERVRAEQERSMAENRADLEERTRLALWRMDALGAPIILQENRYPAGNYQVITPSELRAAPEVLMRFHLEEEDRTQARVAMILSNEVDLKVIEERDARLKQLNALLASNPLPWDEWSRLNKSVERGARASDTLPTDAVMRQIDNTTQRQNKSGQELRKDQAYQANSNAIEFSQRSKAVAQTMDANASQSEQKVRITGLTGGMPGEFGPVVTTEVGRSDEAADLGQMRAAWIGDELFLLRQVTWNATARNGDNPEKRRSLQGVWLDSQKLRKQLLHEVADLLPNAKLVPAKDKNSPPDPLAMVSFPFRLERNESSTISDTPENTRFGAPLWVAWAAVTLAVLTSSLLVRGIMRLSERRASFVSAVTHELRTPLTTFRLYSDMLETGAVKPEKRGEYLRVLSREADRLSHLVENVLAFSRIERGNARSNVRPAAAGDLLEQSRERLEARLATAGLQLEMDSSCQAMVRVDTAAVEHILFNLIDNAAKYAANSEPPVVRIDARESGRFVEIVVSDHGPGIAESEHGRIFRAFHKSAREAAESKPGVGLGLALSRRLAKEQGGDLICNRSACGACFVLRLPGG